MVPLLLILSQKFYRDPMKGAKYGFYWDYHRRPYWSMLDYDPVRMTLRERLLVRLKEPSYSFVFFPPDTLITSGDRACHLYLISEEGTAIERGTIPGCDSKTWVVRLPLGTGARVVVPKGREVRTYIVRNLKVRDDTVMRYGHPIVSCWVTDRVACALDTGIYRGALEVLPLDLETGVTLIAYPWGVRVMRGEDTVVSIRTPSRPMAYSYAHGLLHVALGSHGILTVDTHTGAHTYYRDIPAVGIYASYGKFVVLVEDLDGCIHIFRPVFRPPSVKYVRKAETTFCRKAAR